MPLIETKYLSEVKMFSAEVVEENEAYMLTENRFPPP
jgi:hypothetical protein